MTNDPHAENRKLYEQDALETDKPWERWEFRPIGNTGNTGDWLRLFGKPLWLINLEYRRITPTLTINGHEFPMPLYAKPEGVTHIYMVHLAVAYMTCRRAVDDVFDYEWARGICHLTAEAAVLHAKAILSFSKKEKP